VTAAGALRPDSVLAPAAHVLVAHLDGEAVLYDLVSARPALLNVTAAAVWAALDGERTVGEIVSLLAVEFGSDPATVAGGVESTLLALLERGLVVGELTRS
jgi:hypothetical protein